MGGISFIVLTVSLSFAVEDNSLSTNNQNIVLTEKVQDPELDQPPGEFDEEEWEDEGWEDTVTIADPLEPINRVFFQFNDKLYYWFLKPVARVYAGIFPEELQIAVRNFFNNLRAPGSAVNCLLPAGKGRGVRHPALVPVRPDRPGGGHATGGRSLPSA